MNLNSLQNTPPAHTKIMSSITGVLNLSKSLSDVLTSLHHLSNELHPVLAQPTPPRSFRPRVESTESGATSSTTTSPFTSGAFGSLLSSPVTDAFVSSTSQPAGVAQGQHSRRHLPIAGALYLVTTQIDYLIERQNEPNQVMQYHRLLCQQQEALNGDEYDDAD